MDVQHQQHRSRLLALVGDLVTRTNFHEALSGFGNGAVSSLDRGPLGRPAVSTSVKASVTFTSTVMPRKSFGSPIQVPESGTACRGSLATAMRIRSRLP